MCVTSGGVHLRGITPGQHSFEETWQRAEPLSVNVTKWIKSIKELRQKHLQTLAVDVGTH